MVSRLTGRRQMRTSELNVARANTSAQALYESTGWKQDDQFFMYHRYPARPDPT